MKVKKFVIVILIIAMCFPIISYAISEAENKEKDVFFVSDKTEAANGDIVTMTLNLEKIQYDDFEFTLTSNVNLKEISTEQEKIEASLNENELKIMANKSELNINKIDFYYQIPDNLEAGTKITLIGKIEESTKNEEDSKEEWTKVENVIKDDKTIIAESKEQEVEITITVIEKKEGAKTTNEQANDKSSQESQSSETTNTEKSTNVSTSQDMAKTSSSTATRTTQAQVTTSNAGTQEVNTYKGESNNYLSSLEIEGYELNPVFNKTINTYFIDVEEDIESLEITAKSEDTNAKVSIYGNEDIQARRK